MDTCMNLQCSTLWKLLETNSALVRLVTRVCTRMGSEVTVCGKFQIANCTLKWLFPRVNAIMSLQVTTFKELPFTYFTLERPLSCVGSCMSLQRWIQWKILTTYFTLKRAIFSTLKGMYFKLWISSSSSSSVHFLLSPHLLWTVEWKSKLDRISIHCLYTAPLLVNTMHAHIFFKVSLS